MRRKRPRRMKSARIGNYSGPYFPTFGLNNSEYGQFLRSESLFESNSYKV